MEWTEKDVSDLIGSLKTKGVFVGDSGTHETEKSLEKNRDQINPKYSVEQINKVSSFLREHRLKQTARINKDCSSYGIKSAIENWSGMYINNGATILGFILEGYKYKDMGKNVCFNISTAEFEPLRQKLFREKLRK